LHILNPSRGRASPDVGASNVTVKKEKGVFFINKKSGQNSLLQKWNQHVMKEVCCRTGSSKQGRLHKWQGRSQRWGCREDCWEEKIKIKIKEAEERSESQLGQCRLRERLNDVQALQLSKMEQ
jgi:hypothetical protein